MSLKEIIKKCLKKIPPVKQLHNRFCAVENRITCLERRISALESKLSDLEKQTDQKIVRKHAEYYNDFLRLFYGNL
jgi:uncharacterized coiled-coil DUF342 family protein